MNNKKLNRYISVNNESSSEFTKNSFTKDRISFVLVGFILYIATFFEFRFHIQKSILFSVLWMFPLSLFTYLYRKSVSKSEDTRHIKRVILTDCLITFALIFTFIFNNSIPVARWYLENREFAPKQAQIVSIDDIRKEESIYSGYTWVGKSGQLYTIEDEDGRKWKFRMENGCNKVDLKIGDSIQIGLFNIKESRPYGARFDTEYCGPIFLEKVR